MTFHNARPTFAQRVRKALCLALVTTATLMCAAGSASAAAAKATRTVTPTVLWGAETDDPWLQFSQLSDMEQKAGKKVGLFCFYASFTGSPHFPTAQAQAIAARGATPVVTLEPWDPTAGVDQPAYALDTITNGAHDALLTAWASEAKAWGKPLWLRFGHEMNGNWYPWAEGVNGNQAGDYVAAYRHVWSVFAGAGATNVRWVWNPNVVYPGSTGLGGLYPGDAYVDWVGIDGYNFGTSQSWSTWQSPTTVFDATFKAVRALTNKPIVIAETGSTEVGGSKARWIQDFFALLKANTDVKAFLWFNLNKETDWRIQSSVTAQSAFAAGVGDARYGTP